MVHKVVQSGKPEYIAKKLRVEDGTEMERRACGRYNIKAPEYNLDVSITGFVYRGENLNLRKEIQGFKESVNNRVFKNWDPGI